MKKLKSVTKPKNRKGYYFTPTVDGKTKWIPLGEDYQPALEKYHLTMHSDARPHTVNEGMDLYLRDGGDVTSVGSNSYSGMLLPAPHYNCKPVGLFSLRQLMQYL